MSALRETLKRLLPSLAVDALRDLRVLPRDARRAWWRAAWHHRRQRDDELLPPRLSPPLEIITLCYGNIYRSPVAAALLAREAERRSWRDVRVSSAGFVSREGRPSPEDARAAARALGLSLDAHRSSRLTRERVERAQLLIVMDRQHEALLLNEFPQALEKTVPLWRFDARDGAREEVLHDPYGKGAEVVQACYQRINLCVEALAAALEPRFR